MTATAYDVTGAILDYESGELSDDGIIELFQHLVDTGMIFGLQGSYQRTAQHLINEQMITPPQKQKEIELPVFEGRIVPEQGKGVTHHIGSDRYPYTISQVINDRKIVVRADNFRRTDSNGQSESQTYEITRDPNGTEVTLTYRKNKRWIPQGESMDSPHIYTLGERAAYQNPSF